MTLLPLATLIALLLHFFPCHHVRMEDKEIARNNIIRLRDLDGKEFTHQDAVPHQIKKRSADVSTTTTTSAEATTQPLTIASTTESIPLETQAPLQHTDRGQTCSNISLNDLYDAEECSDAVAYATSFNSNAYYQFTGSWPDYSKGCFIYDAGDMYFNSHSTGTSDLGTRSICKSGCAGNNDCPTERPLCSSGGYCFAGDSYMATNNKYCNLYEEMTSSRLDEAKQECLNDPTCSRFLYSCSTQKYYKCTASSGLSFSGCGSIVYTKAPCISDEECGSDRYCHNGTCIQGILCGRTGTYHHVIECPQDHWCTGYSNKSSQVEGAMDLCEKAAINCGYGQYAPRCSLCKIAHRNEDDSYNSWCGGNCYFDPQDGQCKIKDDYIKVQHSNCASSQRFNAINDAKVACSSNERCIGVLEENCDSSSTYYLCQEDIKKDVEAISCVHKKRETIVSPGEFQQKDGEITCKNRANNTVKEFDFPNDFILDETEARECCQNYCSTNFSCWGCSLICNDGSTICHSGKWNAISECNRAEQLGVHARTLTSQKPICKDVTVKTQYDGQSVNWKLGNCHNARQYDDYREYAQRCCLIPGNYTLTCINSGKPEGWKNSRISFQGVDFCFDFMSFKVFRQIIVEDDPSNSTLGSPSLPTDKNMSIVDSCCSKVILDGSEDLRQIHGDKLGIYEMMEISNTGKVFKLSGSEYYLHRNASTKWIISRHSDIGSEVGFLKEPHCNKECPNKCSSNYWNVYDAKKSQWKIENTVTVECVYSDVLTPGDEGCPKHTIGCTGLGCPTTCYCEDRCSWERCTLLKPPEECLRGTNSTWHLGLKHWTAKSTEGNTSLDQDADENGNLPSSTIKIVKKNSEKEAKLRIEGIRNARDTAILVLIVLFGISSLICFFHSPKQMVNEPQTVVERVTFVFILGCIFMGAYMTVTQNVEFLENRDASIISYHPFNQEPSDQYPTFSICVKGKEIYWEKEELLYDSAGITSAEYVEILKGNGFRYEANENTHLFEKKGFDISNASAINFEHVHLGQTEIITGADLVTNNENSTIHFGNSEAWQSNLVEVPFHIGYQSPDETCFTRNSTYEPNLVRQYDLIFLNSLFLKPGLHLSLEMKTIIHYPGQLLRNYDNPRYTSTFHSHNKDQVLELRISHSTTLKNRPNANVRCDDTIEDDDIKFKEEVVKKIRCVPIYWKSTMWHQNEFEVCHSSEQLRDANFLIENMKNFMESYDPPCVEMTSMVMVNKDLPQHKDELKIVIRYTEDTYQKIENIEAMSLLVLFGQWGGFVGIFLGYSFLQIPQLMTDAKNYFNSKNKKTKEGEEVEKEPEKASSYPGSAGKKTSRRSRKITPKVRKRSLQNSASSRRSSATVIDVSFDNTSPSSQRMDERPIKTSLQELSQSQDIDENTDVPDAADYQAPFGEAAEKLSESSLLSDMKKQLDQLPSERMQGRNEMKRELHELREEMQELQEMQDNRTQELQNEIHEIREEIKTLVNAVEQIADSIQRSVKED